jgi:predicted transcriptional regulator
VKLRTTTCYLDKEQVKRLAILAQRLDTSVAALIRLGIDKILEREEKAKDGLARR